VKVAIDLITQDLVAAFCSADSLSSQWRRARSTGGSAPVLGGCVLLAPAPRGSSAERMSSITSVISVRTNAAAVRESGGGVAALVMQGGVEYVE